MNLASILRRTCILFLIAYSNYSFPQSVVEVAFPNLTFNLAVDLQNAGDNSNRLFAVEQAGIIRVFENNPDVTGTKTYLDIRDRVLSNDRFGLLGMTFHPDYENNGYFFIHYTAANPNRSVIARYSASTADPDLADRDSELIILEVEQPHRFHNGGQLAFGPDGYLYAGFGDGGPFDGTPDPLGHGQNLATLLGSFIRIDIDNPGDGLNYSIPSDNPFVGNTEGYREEIWAWGFRNPWRFSFDPENGLLWTADNGEDRFEEIDIVRSGKNYGWKIMEASVCFSPPSGCDSSGLELPAWEYGGTGQRRSVIGGFMYYGQRNPELLAKYIYADFLTGFIWGLDYFITNERPINTTLLSGFPGIGTFGLDEAGEIYMSNLNDGWIYRFVPTVTSVSSPTSIVETFQLQQNFPNPFNPSTSIIYELPKAERIVIRIYNELGAEVRTLIQAVQNAGRHSIVWDGKDDAGRLVSTGTYIYKLQAGDFSQSRKMTLVK